MIDPEISQQPEAGPVALEHPAPPPEIAPPAPEWQTCAEEQRPPEYGTGVAPKPRFRRQRHRSALVFTALTISAFAVVTTASVTSGGSFLPGLAAFVSGFSETHLSSPSPASPPPATTSDGGEDGTELSETTPNISGAPASRLPDTVPVPSQNPEIYDPVVERCKQPSQEPQAVVPSAPMPSSEPQATTMPDATPASAPEPDPILEPPPTLEPTPAPSPMPSPAPAPPPAPTPSPIPEPTPSPSPEPDDDSDDGGSSGGGGSGGYEPPPHTHTYGVWTDNGDGVTHSRVCAADGDTQTEPHSYGPWESTEDSAGHTRACMVCGAQAQEAHTWDGGVETEPSTCTVQGLCTYTCTSCGAKKTQPIPVLPHDWGDGWIDAGDGVNHVRTCLVGGELETESHSVENGECTVCGAIVATPVDPAPLTMPTAVAPSYSMVENTGVKVHTVFTGAAWTRDPAETGQVVAKWTVCAVVSPDTPVASGEQDVGEYSSGIEVSGLTAGTAYIVTVTLVYRQGEKDYGIAGLVPLSAGFTAEDTAHPHEQHEDANSDGNCDVCGAQRPEFTLTTSLDYDYDGAGQVRLLYTATPPDFPLDTLTFVVQYQQGGAWVDTNLMNMGLMERGFYRWHVYGTHDGWSINCYSEAVEYI